MWIDYGQAPTTGTGRDVSSDKTAISVPEGYRALDVDTLAPYLARLPALGARLGGDPSGWQVNEVGDGNLNLVFIVRGADGGLCVKQALPYVRLVGENWPLPLDRAFFEHEALVEHGRHAPGLTPAVYHFDPVLMLTVMELLEPHIIMRRGMIQGIRYPRAAADMAEYMARTLFFTSDLGMGAAEKKARVAVFCGNTALCNITEALIFTEPYMVHGNNWWTSPQLDDLAAAVRADAPLKRAVSRLKCRFMGSAEALIHGDLHTGSIMVTEDDTRVIDPEFAFYGPMGFDTGAFVGNLLLNYFSQDGHATEADDRSAYKAWVLETIETFWHAFARRYGALWAERAGDAYPAALFEGPEGEALARGCAGLRDRRPAHRHDPVRRGQDDPPHPGSRPQHRFRVDRGSRPPRRLRAPCPAARPGAAGERRRLPDDPLRHRRSAGISRLRQCVTAQSPLPSPQRPTTGNGDQT